MENVCAKCGTLLVDDECPQCVQNQTLPGNGDEKELKTFFVSPNEKSVAVLGNSYMENYFQKGSIKKGFAVVSDKRVYIQGNHYSVSRNARGKMKIVKSQQPRVVDLKDVIGIRIENDANNIWKVLGYIGLVLFLLIFGFGVLVPVLIMFIMV